MVNLTEGAREALGTILASRVGSDGKTLRLTIVGQGFTLRPSLPRPDDQLERTGTAPLLAVGADIAGRLAGMVLDYAPPVGDASRGTFMLRREGQAAGGHRAAP